jgi:hypothetical protein
MPSNKELIKSELIELIKVGKFILYHIAIEEKRISKEQLKEIEAKLEYKEFKKRCKNIKTEYQVWFTKSCNLIRIILPHRYNEFYVLYNDEKRKTKEIGYLNYSISDYFLGLKIVKGTFNEEVIDRFTVFNSRFNIQHSILISCHEIIDSKLNDIEGILQYEIFENELQAADNLLRKNYTRAAGALAGVTLEIHLSKVSNKYNIKFRKGNPTISDFNEGLKNLNVIDIPTWRLIQRLGDIRNLCVHSKDREPLKNEVQDLINGTKKLISELN